MAVAALQRVVMVALSFSNTSCMLLVPSPGANASNASGPLPQTRARAREITAPHAPMQLRGGQSNSVQDQDCDGVRVTSGAWMLLGPTSPGTAGQAE